MTRTLVLIYGILSYLAFFATFLYFMGWINGIIVPVHIDTYVVDGKLLVDRLEESRGTAILIDTLLIALFAIQHTIMARDAFKEKFTKIIPEGAERPTFVLLSSVILALIMWQWRPIPAFAADPLWHFDGDGARYALIGVSFLGFGIVLLSSFLINHFHLFGLQQSFYFFQEKPVPEAKFVTPMLYRYMRHPLMFGILVAIWATPSMTQGHLTFALAFTAYMLMGLWFEERTLIKHLGDDYRDYRKTTSMLIPMPPRNP